MVGGLLVLAVVQSVVPWFGNHMPHVAALYQVNALIIFWGGLTIARRATTLARQRKEAATEPVRAQPTAT